MEEQAAGHALYAGLIDKPSPAQHPEWGERIGFKPRLLLGRCEGYP